MQRNDEPELVKAAQKRDLGAFAILVQRHHADVRACIAVRLGDFHESEDLAQEVFITAFRKIGDCDPRRSIRPWLRAIAMKLLANHRRKFRARPVGSAEELQRRLDDRMMRRHCEAMGNEGEVFEALAECLEQVAEPSRRLLKARYEDSETLDSLAAMLGRKASAVSMQLHRLRQHLASCVRMKLAP